MRIEDESCRVLLSKMAFLWARCLIFVVLVYHSYELHHFSINCGNNQPWETLRNQRFVGHDLALTTCSLPEHSYAKTLRDVGVNPTELKELHLYHLPPYPPLGNGHVAGLNLTGLKITTPHIIFTHSYNLRHAASIDLSNGEDIEIQCLKKTLQLSQITPVLANLTIVHVKKVTIKNCEVPPESYAKAFLALNINPTGITELDLRLRIHEEVSASSLQNLTLQTLSMIWPDPYLPLDINRQVVDVNIFSVVPTIANFHLDGGILPMLSASQLKEVSLRKGASVEEWGDCKELKQLKLFEWEVPEIHNWIARCSKLTSLELVQLEAAYLTRVLSGVMSLNKLRINANRLFDLNETLLADAVFLVKLDLSENSLVKIHRNAFSGLIRLEELNMKDNKLWNASELIDALRPLQRLRKLELDRNTFLDFCRDRDQPMFSMPIQEISLQHTILSSLCFEPWSNLRMLHVSETHVHSVQFNESMLPRPEDHDLLVDMRYCELAEWPTSKSQSEVMIEAFKKTKNITILASVTLDCDCDNGWFARTLRSLPNLEIKGAVCSDAEPLQSSRPDHIQRLECDKSLCEGCICRRKWKDNSTEIDCIGRNMSAVPYLKNIPNLNSLRAAKNKIDTLPDSFPDTLLKVDVSDNDIYRLSPEALAALFSTRARSVALAWNPLICDCENELMIAVLHKHRDQVIDYDNVTCAGDAIRIRDVNIDTLCAAERERQRRTSAVVGGGVLAVSVVAAMAAILCYLYWRQMKVYLFSRGWCLCCLTEHELDGERLYDAFISFAHGDLQLVVEELLPVLEKEYTLCVHTRDWLPGELITTQVFRSVARSRRTVIVLSRNFVRSVWGMLEFRTAYTSALSEGRARVILVLLDDVIDDKDLHDDLRWYLRTNTYLKWGDPWFWKKLRYAMPHKPNLPAENLQPRLPSQHLRQSQIEMETLRDDLENQQPIISDLPNLPAVENGPENLKNFGACDS